MLRGWYPTYVPLVSVVPAAILTYGGSWQVIGSSALLGALIAPPLAMRDCQAIAGRHARLHRQCPIHGHQHVADRAADRRSYRGVNATHLSAVSRLEPGTATSLHEHARYHMDLPELAIAALGGTVSMQARNAGEGVIPTVSGETLLASVPELTTLARVSVETLGLLPSASLKFRVFAGRPFLGEISDCSKASVVLSLPKAPTPSKKPPYFSSTCGTTRNH